MLKPIRFVKWNGMGSGFEIPFSINVEWRIHQEPSTLEGIFTPQIPNNKILK